MSTNIGGLEFAEDIAPLTPDTHRTILGIVSTVLRMTPREDRRTLAEDIALVTNTPILSCGWTVSPLSEYLLLERPGVKVTMSPKTRADLIRELLG